MNELRLAKDFIAEVTREFGRRSKVDGSSEHRREFQLHSRECDEAWHTILVKLDKHVDVAVGGKVFAQHTSEQTQSRDPISIAERGDLLQRKVWDCG